MRQNTPHHLFFPNKILFYIRSYYSPKPWKHIHKFKNHFCSKQTSPFIIINSSPKKGTLPEVPTGVFNLWWGTTNTIVFPNHLLGFNWQSLQGGEDPLGEDMATHSRILAWTEEPGHGVIQRSDLAQAHTSNNHTRAYCFKFTLSEHMYTENKSFLNQLLGWPWWGLYILILLR